MAQLRRGRRASVPVDSSSMIAGNRLFAKNIAVNYITPDWDRVKYPTVMKIVPAISCEGNEKTFEPYRYDTGETGFNDWFATLPIASYVGTGEEKQTFVLYDPLDEDYEIAANPYVYMFNKLKRLAKEKRQIKTRYRTFHTNELISLFDNTVTRDTIAFSKPNKKMVFMNVIPLIHRDKVQVTRHNCLQGCGPDDRPTIMGASTSAGKALFSLAQVEREGAEDSDDFEERYAFGDFTAIRGGKWVSLYKEDLFNEDTFTGKSARAEADEFEGFDEGKKGKTDFVGYAAMAFDSVRAPHQTPGRFAKYGHDAVIAPHGDNILANYRWIGDYFHLPSHEEIVKYLAYGFKPTPELLEVGFDGTDYFTDEIRGIFANRTQVSKPAGKGRDLETDDDEGDADLFSGGESDDDDGFPSDVDDVYEDTELATESKPAARSNKPNKPNKEVSEDVDFGGGDDEEMPSETDDEGGDVDMSDEDVDFNAVAEGIAEEEEEAAPPPKATKTAPASKPTQAKKPATTTSGVKQVTKPAGKSNAGGATTQQSGKGGKLSQQKGRSAATMMGSDEDDDLPFSSK